jgi:hypothetical protein
MLKSKLTVISLSPKTGPRCLILNIASFKQFASYFYGFDSHKKHLNISCADGLTQSYRTSFDVHSALS